MFFISKFFANIQNPFFNFEKGNSCYQLMLFIFEKKDDLLFESDNYF